MPKPYTNPKYTELLDGLDTILAACIGFGLVVFIYCVNPAAFVIVESLEDVFFIVDLFCAIVAC